MFSQRNNPYCELLSNYMIQTYHFIFDNTTILSKRAEIVQKTLLYLLTQIITQIK
jgi:hypothetical protein